jgi:hypothetical protein
MKRALFTFAAAVGLVFGPAAAATAAYQSAYVQVQGEKSRQGWGSERRERGRDTRDDNRREERRERLSEDERRSLHRDLDKANRELYGRRPPK